jgi:hypothetical protein
MHAPNTGKQPTNISKFTKKLCSVILVYKTVGYIKEDYNTIAGGIIQRNDAIGWLLHSAKNLSLHAFVQACVNTKIG